MPKPLQISIRLKTLANPKNASLYLDFNRDVWNESKNKAIRYHFLGLFVFIKPKTKNEREHNNFVYEQAELKKHEIYKEIISGTYGTVSDSADKSLDVDFLELFRKLIGQKKSGSTRLHWENAYKKFDAFTNGQCLIRHLTTRFLHDFKDYLSADKIKYDNEKSLAQNTKRSYLGIILTAVSEAYKRDYLKEDIAKKIGNFPLQKSKRPFLTETEIRILRNTPFPESPVLPRAAFFSILTSLRWDDLRHLKYEQLQYSNESGWFIDFQIKKTDRPDLLYIGREAFELCEYESNKTGAIFPMRYREKDKVIFWFKSAGIEKERGGFHIFRHTFAIRTLNKGESLAVVKELLGHASIKSTEHYARLLGATKRDAAHRQTLDSPDEP